MTKTKKRVDIRLKPNKLARGMAEITENGVSITYKKVTYHTPKEFADAIDYETLVTCDQEFLQLLQDAGYQARSLVKRRENLHVTIPLSLIDRLQQDALDKEMTVSRVVEDILKSYYKDKQE